MKWRYPGKIGKFKKLPNCSNFLVGVCVLLFSSVCTSQTSAFTNLYNNLDDDDRVRYEICFAKSIQEMRVNTTGIDKSLSAQMLQCGHLFNRKGYLESAAEFYQFSIDLNPANLAAMRSLESASRRLGVLEQLNKVEPDCRVYSLNIEVQKKCLSQYFLYGAQPIHPSIVSDLVGWLSDVGDQVITINIEDSQGSNRYCCEANVELEILENLETRVVQYEDEGQGGGWVGYRFFGATTNGIHVIATEENGGGSGIFSGLLLVKVIEGLEFPSISELLDSDEPTLLKSNKKRLYLEKVGYMPIGDREPYTIKVDGNFLLLNGIKIDVSLL